MEIDLKELEELGLGQAAANAAYAQRQSKKLMIAYEHYRFVSPGVVDRFKEALKKKTLKGSKYGASTYDTLNFTSLQYYPQIPPREVLDALRQAKERGCFDLFEVASIETVEVRPDPILFGQVMGCQDRFFIAQWDNDVRIEDILKENEG